MLQQALNRHSKIVIPPETKFFFSFLGQSWRRQIEHVERLNRDLQVQLPIPNRRLTTRSEARSFFELMADLYLERLGRLNAVYFGEKTPEHTGRIWSIRRVFPEAKFLFIYRDGRDVAISLTKVPWMGKDLYVNYLIWLYYCQVLRQIQSDETIDLLCVKYEDVVTDSVAEFGNILNFLGLDYEPAVAKGYGNTEGIPPHEYQWKARALERITSDRIGVWRRALSATEIGALERLGRKTLESLGYELTTGGRDPLSRTFYLGLAWNLFMQTFRLPWSSVVNELLERWQ
jgi:hypothetical protein